MILNRSQPKFAAKLVANKKRCSIKFESHAETCIDWTRPTKFVRRYIAATTFMNHREAMAAVRRDSYIQHRVVKSLSKQTTRSSGAKKSV